MKCIKYNDLVSIIQNKRVAIVGPADYVNKEISDNHGDYIDSFDIVIRLNGMIKYPEENTNINFEKYYGKKFNILASSFWNKLDGGAEFHYSKNPARYLDINMYKDISHDLILFETFDRTLFNDIYNKNKSFFDNKKNLTYCNSLNMWSAHQYLNNIYLNNVQSPIKLSTGIITIGHILTMNPKELYVTGITCFQDNKYNGFYDWYELISPETAAKTYKDPRFMFDGKKVRNNCSHEINNEAKQIQILIKRGIITVDKYLDTLFKNI